MENTNSDSRYIGLSFSTELDQTDMEFKMTGPILNSTEKLARWSIPATFRLAIASLITLFLGFHASVVAAQQSVSAVQTDTGEIRVTWSGFNNNLGFVSRDIERRIGSTGQYQVVQFNVGGSGNLIDDQLDDGTYYYRMNACVLEPGGNAGEDCDYWDASPVVLDGPLPPQVPVNVRADTNGAYNDLVVTWDQVSGATGYQVAVSSNGGSSYSAFANTVNGGAPSENYNNLPEGSYRFKVKACNTTCGDESLPSNIVAVISGGPASISATKTDADSVEVSWGTNPAFPGQYYFEEYRDDVLTFDSQYGVNGSPQSRNNLTEGSYQYFVTACSGDIDFPDCEPPRESQIVTISAPGTPAQLIFNESATIGTGTLQWQERPNDEFVSHYEYGVRLGTAGWSAYSQTTGASSQTVTVNTDGEYSLRVRACNAIGCGGDATHTGWSVRRPPVLGPVNASFDGAANRIRITWSKISGSADSYSIDRSTNGVNGWVAVGSTSGALAYTATGVPAGNQYFRVTGCYPGVACGERVSEPMTVGTPTAVAPIQVVQGASSGDIVVNWPAGVGYIDRYEIQESVNGAAGNWSPMGIVLTREFRNRDFGTYSYSVRACNDVFGCGSPVSSQPYVVLRPGDVEEINVSVEGDEIEITWSEHSGTSGSEYQLQVQTNNGDWISLVIDPEDPQSVTQTMADVGIYQYRIRACDGDDCGAWNYSDEVVVQSSPNAPSTVGALAGSLSVSTGSASYSIPIQVPPGRNGMTPSVSLEYNSASGTGRAGIGWSVQAASLIARCDKTWVQDGVSETISFTDSDRFCLNGTRLVLTGGEYGANNSTYRTEVDNFDRVTAVVPNSSAGPSAFVVESASGNTLYFGGSAALTAQGRSQSMVWPLERATDRFGNEIRYHYETDVPNGEYYLESITYTHTEGAAENSSTDRKVAFVYEDRHDKLETYLSGSIRRTTNRLAAIRTFIGPLMKREYSLQYLPSESSGASRLFSVSVCAYDEMTPTGLCLPASVFDWSDGSPYAYTEDFPGLQDGPAFSFPQDAVTSADINGDGRMDFVSFKTAGLTVWYGEDGGFSNAQDVPVDGELSSDVNVSDNPTLDWNFDGKTDFTAPIGSVLPAGPEQPSWIVFPQFDSDGQFEISWTIPAGDPVCYEVQRRLVSPNTGFTPFTSVVNPQLPFDTHPNGPYQYQVRAYNSEGLASSWSTIKEVEVGQALSVAQSRAVTPNDNCIPSFNPDNSQSLSVIWFDSSNSVQVFDTEVPISQGDASYVIVDVNGDGRHDIVTEHENQYKVYLREAVGDGFVLQSSPSPISSLGDESIAPIDFNGDGRADLFAYRVYPQQPRVLVSTGTGFEVVQDVLPIVGFGEFEAFALFDDVPDSYGEIEPPQPPVLGDFNGDGLTDAIIAEDTAENFWTTSGNIYLYINTGSGFEGVDTGYPTPFARRWGERLGYYLQVFDYDGDGDLDLLLPDPTRDHFDAYGPCFTSPNLGQVCDGEYLSENDGYYWNVMRFNGVTLDAPEQTSIWMPLTGSRTLDLNGDGRDDLLGARVRSSEDQAQDEPYPSVYLSQGVPDLLTGIVDGLSKKTTIQYSNINSSETYTLDDELRANNFPVLDFVGAMNVVREVAHSNGLGEGMNVTQYTYQNAKYHLQGRGFQGFEVIEESDIAAGVTTRTTHHQMFPLTGRVDVRSLRDSGLSADGPYLQTSDFTWNIQSTDTGGSQHVYLHKQANEYFEPADGYAWMRSNSLTTTIDDYGCVDTVAESSDSFEQHLVTADSSYSNDETNWWLCKQTGQATTTKVTHLAEPFPSGADWIVEGEGVSNTKTRIESYEYYPHRKLMSVERNTLDSNLYSKSQYDYDAFGNLTWTQETAPNGQGVYLLEPRIEESDYSETSGYFANSMTNAMGHVTTYTYNSVYGEVKEKTDPNSIKSIYEYDSFGRVDSVTQDGRSTLSNTYAICDDSCPINGFYQIESVQPGYATSVSVHDILGREIQSRQTGFDGTAVITESGFDQVGRLIFESEPHYEGEASPRAEYENFDILDRPSIHRWPNGTLTTYSYKGLTTESTVSADGKSLTESRSMNSRGELVRSVDAINGSSELRRDAFGSLVYMRNAKQQVYSMAYDELGQRISVVQPDSGSSTFVYDAFGQLRLTTDAKGNSVYSTYDKLGRQVTKSVAVGDATPSVVATWVYDGPSGQQAPFIGKLYSAETAGSEDGVRRLYDYSPDSGLLTSVTSEMLLDSDVRLFEFTYGYDDYGRQDYLKYPSGFEIEYSFNNHGYLYKERQLAPELRTLVEVLEMSPRGQVERRAFGENGVTQHVDYSPETGLVTSVCTVGNDSVCDAITADVQSLGYAYDGFNNVLSRTNFVASVKEEFLDYDDLHRLKESRLEHIDGTILGSPKLYEYDALGNFTSKSDYASEYRYEGAQVDWTDFAGPNAVTSVVRAGDAEEKFSYDLNGNMLSTDNSGTGVELTYNFSNKPATLRKNVDGATTALTGFSYDYNQKRWKQRVIQDGSTASTLYVNNQYELLKSVSADGSVVESQRHYLGDYGVFTLADSSSDVDGDGVSDGLDNCREVPNADQRDSNLDGYGNVCDADLNNDGIINVVDLGMLRTMFFTADEDADLNGDGVVNVVDLGMLRNNFFEAPGPNGFGQNDLLYKLSDNLGSTDTIVDQNGQVKERFGYDAFGDVRSGDWQLAAEVVPSPILPGYSSVTPRGFTGHEHLSEFGLIHMKGRVYHPSLGRFMGVDPFIQDQSNSQNYNPYSYVLNNPLSMTDPSGYRYSRKARRPVFKTAKELLAGFTTAETRYRNSDLNPAYAIQEEMKARIEALKLGWLVIAINKRLEPNQDVLDISSLFSGGSVDEGLLGFVTPENSQYDQSEDNESRTDDENTYGLPGLPGGPGAPEIKIAKDSVPETRAVVLPLNANATVVLETIETQHLAIMLYLANKKVPSLQAVADHVGALKHDVEYMSDFGDPDRAREIMRQSESFAIDLALELGMIEEIATFSGRLPVYRWGRAVLTQKQRAIETYARVFSKKGAKQVCKAASNGSDPSCPD